MKRRKFIKRAACAGMGTATFFSTIGNLMMTNSLAAKCIENNDYKALVCVLLAGGNDSFNMLIPYTNHSEYLDARGGVAVPISDLSDTQISSSGVFYALHPSLTNIKSLYNSEKISFVANVGTLVNPISNVAEYENSSIQKPNKLFSHSDQIHQWQTGIPNMNSLTGWGGRIADILQNPSNNFSMNISLGGRNAFQVGNQFAEYSVSNNGPQNLGSNILSGSNAGFLVQLRNSGITDMMSNTYTNAFQQTFQNQSKRAIELSQLYSDAIADSTIDDGCFADSKLSQDLKMVAKLIDVRSQIGMQKQIFFVSIGGWDHHDNLLGNSLNSHADKLTVLDQALSCFYNALLSINMQNNVTTFTASDFGRTLTSNGNGTDHAWGGNHLVMGGDQLDGGRIIGDYPNLMSSNRILANKAIIPQISTDEYFAELALWYGVAPGDLAYLFPNIGNFYDPYGGTLPLEFLS